MMRNAENFGWIAVSGMKIIKRKREREREKRKGYLVGESRLHSSVGSPSKLIERCRSERR